MGDVDVLRKNERRGLLLLLLLLLEVVSWGSGCSGILRLLFADGFCFAFFLLDVEEVDFPVRLLLLLLRLWWEVVLEERCSVGDGGGGGGLEFRRLGGEFRRVRLLLVSRIGRSDDGFLPLEFSSSSSRIL